MKKYVSLDKRSKKAQREYYSERRRTWGKLNPVTRSVPSGKTYNRKKEKKRLLRAGGMRLATTEAERRPAENSVMNSKPILLFYPSEKLAKRSFHSFTHGAGERIFISVPRVKSQPQKVGDF